MTSDRKKVKNQRNRIIIIQFLSFVLLFIFLGIFNFILVNMFFFREVNREMGEFREIVRENILENDVNGKIRISVSPRTNARIFAIYYDAEGNVLDYDHVLLDFFGEDADEYHPESYGQMIFQFQKELEWNLEALVDEETYHFRTLSFPVANPNAPHVKACKLLIMVNGEVKSRNLVIRIYFLSSLFMFIFAFLASLYVSGMTIKPVRTALEKQLSFVSDASHELRTPLAIVRNRLENILTKSNRTVYEVSDDIAICLKEITRLSKLTNDLLTLSRSDSETMQMKIEEFDLLEFSKDVAVPFSEMAEIQNKVFTVTGVKTSVSADKAMISQLLIILLDNALKYTAEGEKIEINVEPAGGEAELVVSDTGTGIENEIKPLVFERFFRADKARSRDTGGYGLGLAIAKVIVEQHKGRITLEDNVPKGTKITVTLPKLKKLEKK